MEVTESRRRKRPSSIIIIFIIIIIIILGGTPLVSFPRTGLLPIRWRSDGSDEPTPPHYQVIGSLRPPDLAIPSSFGVSTSNTSPLASFIGSSTGHGIAEDHTATRRRRKAPARTTTPRRMEIRRLQPALFSATATPWSHGPHEHIRRSFAGPFGPFTFGLATPGPIIGWTREPLAVSSPSGETNSVLNFPTPPFFVFRCRKLYKVGLESS
ncbi:hypothetical protein BHE74_00054118 [Ensete ventricosum]|nr:hypothetical protein BHE74_00054118 [Ensete ventricosum]